MMLSSVPVKVGPGWVWSCVAKVGSVPAGDAVAPAEVVAGISPMVPAGVNAMEPPAVASAPEIVVVGYPLESPFAPTGNLLSKFGVRVDSVAEVR